MQLFKAHLLFLHFPSISNSWFIIRFMFLKFIRERGKITGGGENHHRIIFAVLHLIFPVFAIKLSENDNLEIAICSFRKFFVWQHRYVIPIRNQFAFYLFWDCNKIEHYANGENFTKRRPQSTNIWTKWCIKLLNKIVSSK